LYGNWVPFLPGELQTVIEQVTVVLIIFTALGITSFRPFEENLEH
jgi:hypothetical protein